MIVCVVQDGGRAKIQSMNIESEIKLRYARTLVSSRVVNPAKVAQTATFHVVLPETAFISGFLMQVFFSCCYYCGLEKVAPL